MTTRPAWAARIAAMTITAAAALLAGCAWGSSASDEEAAPSEVDPLTGAMGTSVIDYSRPTHIILVGYSHGQGDQFVSAAAARALRYRDLYPNRQVVFYADPEVAGHTDADVVKTYGIKMISESTSGELAVDALIKTLAQYNTIYSIDVYAHSSPWSVGLEPGVDRLSTWTPSWLLRTLKPHFAAEAYVTLNGCSAGTELAPFLSSVWKVPVSGALTSSNFERLHSNGQWYVDDAGKYPEGGWATKNAESYSKTRSCSKGGCLRLKPVNFEYHGSWGDFGGGLGFYKFYCNYEGSLDDCEKRMALSLLSYPSTTALTYESTREEFEEVVLDYLCPDDMSGTLKQECREGIRNAVGDGTYVYSSFKGNKKPLACDVKRCQVQMKCQEDEKKMPISGTCTSVPGPNPSPTTQAREYQHFVRGFDLLQAEQ